MEFSPNFISPPEDDEDQKIEAGFEALAEKPVSTSMPPRARRSLRAKKSSSGLLKGVLLSAFLVCIVAGSFWLSFQLGKNMLSPLKEEKTQDTQVEARAGVSSQVMKQADEIFKEELMRLKGKKVPKKEKSRSVISELTKIFPQKTQAKVVNSTIPSKTVDTVDIETPLPVKKAIPQKPAVNKSGGYIAQAGVFGYKSNASGLVSTLNAKGFSSSFHGWGKYWRVVVGQRTSLSQASNLVSRLKSSGFEAIVSGR